MRPTLTVVTLAALLACRSARGFEAPGEAAPEPVVIGAVDGYRSQCAIRWYRKLTLHDGPRVATGVGFCSLPDEADRSLSPKRRAQSADDVRVWALHFVKRADVVWLTGHGKKLSLRVFGRTFFDKGDLKEARCRWVVLDACSITDVKLDVTAKAMTGTGVEWLRASPRLHGVLGYNAGARWFGEDRRENAFVGDAFAAELLRGTSIARAWMLANRDAANRFKRHDRKGQFSSTNATAVVWEAHEGETLATLSTPERKDAARARAGIVFMSLERGDDADDPWRIVEKRGRLAAAARPSVTP